MLEIVPNFKNIKKKGWKEIYLNVGSWILCFIILINIIFFMFLCAFCKLHVSLSESEKVQNLFNVCASVRFCPSYDFASPCVPLRPSCSLLPSLADCCICAVELIPLGFLQGHTSSIVFPFSCTFHIFFTTGSICLPTCVLPDPKIRLTRDYETLPPWRHFSLPSITKFFDRVYSWVLIFLFILPISVLESCV